MAVNLSIDKGSETINLEIVEAQNGKSAFEVWQEENPEGTYADWQASLKGQQGVPFKYEDFTQAQKDQIFNTYLSNFYSPSVVALNSRGVNEGATFGVKLHHVQNNLGDENASLALIPSVYKTGKLYSVIPADGTGDFTVDRASSATRVNAEGLIELVDANVPRIDWSTGEPMLLVEGQATNKIPFSIDFQDAWYMKYNSAVVSIHPSISAPDGTMSARLIDLKAATSAAVFRNEQTTVVNGDVKSIWARTVSGTGKINLLRLYTTNGYAQDAGLYDLTEQWQRFELPVIADDANDKYFIVADRRGSGVTLTECLVWGAQLEEGSKATSYIPTAGSTVTRMLDRLRLSRNFGAEGSIIFDLRGLNNVNADSFKIGNFHFYRYGTPMGYQIYDRSRSTWISAKVNVEEAKVAIKFNDIETKVFINGANHTINSGVTVPSSNINIDLYPDASDKYLSSKSLKIYPIALTDQQLIELTTL